jgi:hypothetical protein
MVEKTFNWRRPSLSSEIKKKPKKENSEGKV